MPRQTISSGSPAELISAGPACCWLLDAAGKFHEFYGNGRPLFGIAATEILGLDLVEAVGKDSIDTWNGRLTRVIGGETLVLRERRDAAQWFICLYPVSRDGVAWAGGLAHEITLLSAAEKELRNTVLGALKAQEFDRSSLSRFLHDSVAQNLTALGLQLDLIRMDLGESQSDTRERIAEVQRLLEVVMEQVREYSYQLNPSTVERAGLRWALDRLEPRFRGRYTGVLRVNCDPKIRIEPKIAAAMYQIAVEAVENAVQHAGCSLVEIAVKSSRSGASLEVRDNGKGFDPAGVLEGSRGLGLLSMEHHAAQAGLDLTIKSSPRTGTTVRTSTPGRRERAR